MKIGIFGLGLAGEELARLAGDLGWEVAGFSRSRSIGEGRRLDASLEEECSAFRREGRRFDAAVATFPPQQAWPGFWSALAETGGLPILLGTTGSYVRRGERPRITESTPIQPDHPRREAEEALLRAGGVLLRLSGIYGGPRNPLDWIERGRVGYEDRQVNLVHCSDIAAAVVAVIDKKPRRRIYNVSDGQRHTWRQIIDHLVERGWIRHDRVPAPLKRPDGFIDNGRFLAEYPDFRFRDFWAELERLRRGRGGGA